jgi:signal transduction histidine kinase
MRAGLRALSLRAKFILASVTVIVLITTLMSLFVLDRFRRSLDIEIAKRGETLAGQLGTLAQLPLRTGSRERLNKLAQDALLIEDVVSIEFLDADEKSLVKVARDAPAPARTIRNSYPVIRQERMFQDEMEFLTGTAEESQAGILGTINVELSLASTDRIVERISATIFIMAALLAILSILFSIHFARRITDPIKKLTEGVMEIGEGRLDVEIEVKEEGEIGILAEHFNQMARDLKVSVDQMIQQEKMATLGRMASFISHDIGSPLNSVMFDAQIIMEELKEGPALESARQITAQTRRMRDTIRSLLDYARPPSGELHEVNMEQALEEAVLVLTHKIRKSGLKITARLGHLPKAYAVKNLIVQVFVNLINNTIDATGQDGQLAVEARDMPDTSTIQLIFSDNGPGIPEEHLDKIFEPFYTTKPEGEGAGLGLSICRHIMRSIGGDIRADRGPDGGTIFTLFFKPAR